MSPAVLLAVALLTPAIQAPVAAGSAAMGPAPVRIERRLAAMGTWLELSVHGADRRSALQSSEHAVRALESVEARLSTWVEGSELARLNRAPVGEVVPLSDELAADLARAAHFWRATGGAFDPGLGALVAAWGLRTGGRAPSEAELAAARATGGFAAFELDGRTAVRRHALGAVEEGAFGKGIGLDAALAALAEDGVREAVIDLGGQLAVLGAPVTATLADPRARARPVLELVCAPGSLSTSGNGERGIVVDGVARGHVLDPATGAPAADFGSLTVWAADATAADCLSTGLYVLGPERAFEWRAAHPEIELVVLLVEDGKLRALASEGWRGRLRPLVPDLELSVVAEGSLPVPIPPHPAPIQR